MTTASHALSRVLAIDTHHPVAAEISERLNRYFTLEARPAKSAADAVRIEASAGASGTEDFRLAEARIRQGRGDPRRPSRLRASHAKARGSQRPFRASAWLGADRKRPGGGDRGRPPRRRAGLADSSRADADDLDLDPVDLHDDCSDHGVAAESRGSRHPRHRNGIDRGVDVVRLPAHRGQALEPLCPWMTVPTVALEPVLLGAREACRRLHASRLPAASPGRDHPVGRGNDPDHRHEGRGPSEALIGIECDDLASARLPSPGR